MTERGIRVSAAVLTAVPLEAGPRPVEAMALLDRLRAESAATALAAGLLPLAETVPATALLPWVPLAAPPDLLTYTYLSESGLCQYCGATSITTWYWFCCS